MWLTRLALRNPVLILMMSLMVIALGALSSTRLSVDLFPNIDIPVIRVATFYPGAGPEDIEKSITQPIERAVASSPGVDRVESTSKQGASIVSVWFNYGTNLDTAQFDVQQRVAQMQSQLPPGIQQPYILKFDVTNIPVVQVVVRAEGLDEKQLYDLTFNVIQPQLERLTGIASATVSGGQQREIEVKVDREQLRARSLGILDVVGAVRGANFLLPSGNLRAGDRDYNVFTNTQVDTVRVLGDVVVKPGVATGGGAGESASAVRVSDVATVVDGIADQANIVRINGTRGVYLRVFKQPGANTIAAVDAVRAALPNLRGIPPNVKAEISFDQSTYIRAAVSALQHEAVQGGLLAVLVILVFLVSFRATGIVAVAIPLSIVATFILLYFFNQTLNVFTLGGLALAVGRLVDDSIVELENIHRHLQITTDRRKAVLDAAQEVAMPILVSTITTVIVFFPVLFLTGVAKNLFLPLAMTITFALVMSFFVSRTVTPLLCLSWLSAAHPRGAFAWLTRGLERIDAAYASVLRRVLAHRFVVIASIGAVFIASLTLLRFIGSEFFPDSDERQFSVTYKTPIGTRVERTEQVGARVEAVVRRELADGDHALFTTMLSDNGLPGGRTALFTSNTGPHAGNINVNLVPRDQRPYSDVQATERVRSALKSELPGVNLFYFTGGIVKRILNFGAPAPIDVEILGYDLEKAASYASAVAEKLRGVHDAAGRPLLTDVQISREENYPELDVVVDREKAGVLGVTEQQIAQSVLASLVGNTQFTPIPFADPATGNSYFINVKLADAYRSHVGDLEDIFLRTPAGRTLPLANLAKIERSSGPVQITRKYLQRIIDVTANVAPGRDLGAASDAAQRAIDSVPAPDGFSVQLGGQTIAQKQAFQGLGLAAIMALALVYMVLASQFKSLLDPLVIMFSVPLGVSGVFAMLAATKTTLSVNSAMGIIMMVGIVVSNGVLLVDFANVLRRRGAPLLEATVDAAKTRLRPILMTTIATVAGLLPMALGIGEGSETNLPLARAVIGGLTVSTFFTLFLIPCLYTLVDRFKKKRPHDEDPEAVHA
ncbi:MAG: efflux RND transporter permease subunit [Labilithrix sp.]|nr:efflux RND transporter permease subunit [Labilithrix sp.]